MAAVTSYDHGYAALLRRITTFGEPRIVVGVLTAKPYARPPSITPGKARRAKRATRAITVLDIAHWMENGTRTIPARSFIRAWFDENDANVFKWIDKLLPSVLRGQRTREQILELVGQKAVAGIQKRIADGIAPPNAAATIARKGSAKPLIHTGQLRSALTYAVLPAGR